MKKNLLTFLAFFISLNFMMAATGVFESYVFFSKNGSDDNYKGSLGHAGTVFNGASLGDVSSLTLKGGELKTFKNSGGDVTGAGLQYKIYKQGSSPGGFIFQNLPFNANIGGGGDQSWRTDLANINLFSSVTSNGTWVIEVYWEAYTNEGNRTDNCGGSCVATFTVTTLSAELSAFSAQKVNNSIALSWLTSTEQNNSHFNIEHSSNGKSFTTIGQVKGSGTTASSNKYNFTDNNPLSGVNYYRLNAVETTGKTAFSKIVTVNYSSKGNSKLVAYPNPAKSALNINYESIEDAALNIQVLDMTGKVHLSKQMEGLKGDNNIRLNIENLPNGAYFMRINDNTTKFFKM